MNEWRGCSIGFWENEICSKEHDLELKAAAALKAKAAQVRRFCFTHTHTHVSVHEGHSRSAGILATPASRGRSSNALPMLNDLAHNNCASQPFWRCMRRLSGAWPHGLMLRSASEDCGYPPPTRLGGLGVQVHALINACT